MKTILETVLYKRTPEELEKICKDVNASRSWRITHSGKLTYYALFNSVTRERKYKWEKGKSHLPFKEWYSKYCPKVSHDYTLGELMEDAIHSPMFHISLALAWIGINGYIAYYKTQNTLTEDEENKILVGLIISSFILHYLLYFFLKTVSFSFLFGGINILSLSLLLLNPIIPSAVILILNVSNYKDKDTYKKYLWRAYNGSTILYSILGLIMGWVSLWFWL
jgi:hypothetical protein